MYYAISIAVKTFKHNCKVMSGANPFKEIVVSNVLDEVLRSHNRPVLVCR